MELINNIQSDILENLGRFAYLTVSQLQRLTGKSLSYLREQLANLSQRKYIKSYHIERPGRAENIYYLMESGKEILLHHEKVFADGIRMPVGVPLVVRDYQHRKNFIDMHIALYHHIQALDIAMPVFLTYFDKQGNNRTAHNLESKTKISLGSDLFFMPDGIMVTQYGNSKTLYLLEMYNGKDTLRTLQQLAKHAKTIALGTASQKFGIQSNPFILCAFEYESSKIAVVKRLQQNERFAAMSELFFFAALETIQNNCANAFENIHKKPLCFEGNMKENK
jgi:DNA-binding MarR family transcriptional regulator